MNNEVSLQGKLADEVTVETSKNGKPYANGRLEVEQAVDDGVKTQTYPFTVFGAAAQQLADYKRGAQLEIAGQLNRDDYKNKDGEMRTSYALIGRRVTRPQKVGSKNAMRLSGFVQSSAEDGRIELKTSQDGNTKYVNFGVSVKRDGEGAQNAERKAQYDTFYVSAFGDAASHIAETYRKGDLVDFRGHLSFGKFGLSPIVTDGTLIRDAKTVKEGVAAAEQENKQVRRKPRSKTATGNNR